MGDDHPDTARELAPANAWPGRGGPVPVPGSVYADLLAAGKMEDPYYRDNEDAALALMEKDFLYAACFVPEEGILNCPTQVLRFEGVDTVADIRLNGVLLAHVENMHRTFEFEVGGILKPGENWMEVKLYSPTRWIREQYAAKPGGRQPRRHEGLCQPAQGPLHVRLGLGPPSARRGHVAAGFPAGNRRRPAALACRCASTMSTAG